MNEPDKRMLACVLNEYADASNKFEPLNSAHEGFAVLKEEVDELWDEVKKNPRKDPLALSPEDGEYRRRGYMRNEAIQVAAMALRFLNDITPFEPENR